MTGARNLPVVPGLRRVIGRAGGRVPGPTLVFVAGLHGNEPSGIAALERVFSRIRQRRVPLRGEMVGLAGNLAALAAGRRYLGRDLNRMWTRDAIDRASEGASGGAVLPEEAERRELLRAMREVMERARGEILVVDLHSASSRTSPFVILGDTLRNREFARRFPVPAVLGVEEQLDGTLMEYVTGLGHVSVAFEGGQHDDPASVVHHEAAIWLALEHAGVVARADVPGRDGRHDLLTRASRGVPPVLEIVHRHPVGPGDGFAMRPGYRNFQPVRRGEPLATDRNGAVRSPGSYLLFLPLYQGLGSDGFFLARPVDPIWLGVSSVLRRWRASELAPRLPGVRRHPESRSTLLVGRRVARFLVPQVFHLLGYRVRPIDDGDWEATRRRE